MTTSAWHPQLLVAFLESVWSARTESAAALTAVERAAETFDAEVAAIMSGEHLVAAVGYPEGATPVGELSRFRADGTRHRLDVPGVGPCEAACVSLDYPPGGTFILARSGPGGLHREEAILLRGMARVASMAMRTQSLLDAERAAREESDRQAGENARLLAELTQRQARLTELAGEQAALRRVATLAAGQAPPGRKATLVATGVAAAELFDAVTAEMRLLLGATAASLLRFERDGTATVLAADSEPGLAIPVRTRLTLDGKSVAAAVYRTGRTARIDGFGGPPGSIAAAYRDLGMRAAAGAPIIVEGRLWGAIVADWRRPQAVPAGTEGRIAQFTQLVGTAISNAASRAQLAASRARIVATADETRRRLERDLHDGIQQRLVALALELRTIRGDVPPGHDDLVRRLAHAGAGLVAVLDELREISRGVHPAILSQGGLVPAVRGLARRSGVPVELSLGRVGRLPEHVEVAAYYATSEALANAAKHAHATMARVELTVDEAALHLSIRDDGAGGADPARGSGIIGLIDRVDALGGTMTLSSPPGEGTSLVIALPLEPPRP